MMVGIAAMSVFVMMSCGSKDGSKENKAQEGTEQVAENEDEEDADEAAPKTEEGVIAMLEEAYSDANIISQPEDEMEPNIDLFALYCSKEINEKMEQIREIEVNTGEKFDAIPDELGMFIYWEGATVTLKDMDVDIDGDTATATYNVSNGSDELITVVDLVYEDGQWHIDNWQQIGMLALDVKERMDEFIEEHK